MIHIFIIVGIILAATLLSDRETNISAVIFYGGAAVIMAVLGWLANL